MGNTNNSIEKEEQSKREKALEQRAQEWQVVFSNPPSSLLVQELVQEDKAKFNKLATDYKSALAGENVEKNRYQSVLARNAP